MIAFHSIALSHRARDWEKRNQGNTTRASKMDFAKGSWRWKLSVVVNKEMHFTSSAHPDMVSQVGFSEVKGVKTNSYTAWCNQ